MSTHAEDGRLLAYMDRELPPAERTELEAHLSTCIACRHAMARVRSRAQLVTGALALADHPAAAAAAWQTVRSALSAETPSSTPRSARQGRSGAKWGPGRWALARAAGLVLLLTAGAAAAVVPGSPVRNWLLGDGAPVTVETTPEAAVAPVPTASGSWTRAVEGQVTLALSAPAGTEVEVVWEGSRAGFTGPADTRYTSSEDGQLEAEVLSGPVRVELPAEVRHATLRVNGAAVLSIRDGRVTGAPEDALGQLTVGGEPMRFQVR